MTSVNPPRTRQRKAAAYMTAQDAKARADELFAAAEAMQPGTERQSVLKQACDYRWLAEMKAMMSAPQPSIVAQADPSAKKAEM